MIIQILNFFHLLFIFSPIIIYLIPIKYSIFLAKWLLLITALVPLHWVYFNDKCFVTELSKEMGNYQNTKTTSSFSEKHLKWLYYPIMRLFGWKWNSDGLAKMVNFHLIINVFLLWIFCFYVI